MPWVEILQMTGYARYFDFLKYIFRNVLDRKIAKTVQ